MVDNQNAELKRFVPVSECIGKPFQMDDYGNFRIVVKGKESEWVGYERIAILKIENEQGGNEQFIGVSEYFKGYIPTECVLKIEEVDEDGEPNFYKFKIADLVSDKIMNQKEIDEILRDPPFDAEDFEDFGYTVKESSQKDFVKIRMEHYDIFGEIDRFLTKEEVIDALIDIFSAVEYDVYDEDNNLINR